MNDWTVVPLASLTDDGRGICYGVVQPGQPDPTGVPVVRVSDIRGGRVATNEPLRISKEVESQYARSRLRGGELLLTLVGTVGELAVAPVELRGWNTARAVGVIPVRPDIGAEWVRYALTSGALQEHMGARLNTTVQATLNLRDVAALPVPLPPAVERRAIVRIPVSYTHLTLPTKRIV